MEGAFVGQRSAEKLAGALDGIPGMPGWMIDRAKAGYYGDYTTDLSFPQMELITDLTRIKQSEGMPVASRKLINAVIRDVRSGEYDGTSEEAEEWAASPEGQQVMRELLGELPE